MSQPSDVNRNVTKSYVSLGSNVTSRYGNPTDTLNFAVSCLSGDSVNLLQTSPFYATPAFPKGSGPDFVNAVAALDTTLQAAELLAFLHEIETKAGRNRINRWEPRTLDLDLISYGSEILPNLQTHQSWVDLALQDQLKSTPEKLIVPHPRLHDRAFVLIPLRDVAPNWTHPVTKKDVNSLINMLPAEDIASIKPLAG